MFDPVVGIHRDLVLIPNKLAGAGIHSLVGAFLCTGRFRSRQNLEGTTFMQTLYVGLVFSMMVVLPLLVAKWGGSPQQDLEESFGSKRQ
jgi:hypothetical protein